MGSPPPEGPTIALGEFRQSAGKLIAVFAREGDMDAAAVRSNEFEIEWPPRSGRMQRFPEIDRAEWMTPDVARTKVVKGQVPVIDALAGRLSRPPGRGSGSR